VRREEIRKIEVHVKPNARRTEVTEIQAGLFQVVTNAPPIDGRANEAVIEALAEYFDVPKSRVVIRHGLHSRKKFVEILPD
jgi:uncharacterized protein